jgi:hypothetical protein
MATRRPDICRALNALSSDNVGRPGDRKGADSQKAKLIPLTFFHSGCPRPYRQSKVTSRKLSPS